MTPGNSNVAASVRQRLLNLAKQRNEDFQQVLVRYALERLLYRMTQSPHAGRFVLKGALLFRLWFDLQQRPTRDADFLGFGNADPEQLRAIFQDIVSIPPSGHDDGMIFDVGSVAAIEIRKEAGYPGVRISMLAMLDGARIPVQCDVGFGDVITPELSRRSYPALLDMPAPVLAVYPLETVVAEKLEALVKLGSFNTRLKDFFDLWVLLRWESLDKDVLPKAIQATFTRRNTLLPKNIPVGLTDAFAAEKQKMWQAFLARSGLEAPSLMVVMLLLRDTCWPLLQAAADYSD